MTDRAFQVDDNKTSQLTDESYNKQSWDKQRKEIEDNLVVYKKPDGSIDFHVKFERLPPMLQNSLKCHKSYDGKLI